MKVVFTYLWSAFALSAAGVWIVELVFYSVSIKRIKKEDSQNDVEIYYEKAVKIGWFGLAGFYSEYIRPPFPILRISNNKKTVQLIKQHNILVKVFWFLIVLAFISFVISCISKQ